MEFGLYVTPVAGRTVPRFGAPRGSYIGARRAGNQLEWDEERIVAIPADEYRRYRAEYDGAITDGSLKRRKAQEYEAQQKKRAEANRKAKEEARDAEVKRVRAVTETAATVPPPAEGERPRPILLGKDGK